MNSLSKNLEVLVRAHFPDAVQGDLWLEPIEKGGSDRVFHRVRDESGASLIVIRYSSHREENRHYVEIADFLAASGVHVPKMYLHYPAEGLILMEDLGEADLWQFRETPWEERRPLYQSALDQALLLHTRATARLPHTRVHFQMEFNEELYLWEQEYFFENCLGGFFRVPTIQMRALPALRAAARRLASLPRVLVHRDFQSQNVLIARGRTWLIDFQGARPGLPHYDLASLVYDPYVSFTSEERAVLTDYYRRKAIKSGLEISKGFEEIFSLCAMQRLMQALGAYGFLGLQKGKRHFLDFIPVAGHLLCQVLGQIEGLEPLKGQLERLCRRTP